MAISNIVPSAFSVASALISTGPCTLWGLSLTASATGATMYAFDSKTAASGPILAQLNIGSAVGDTRILNGLAKKAVNGVFVVMTGASLGIVDVEAA